jgi:hypothetical protein
MSTIRKYMSQLVAVAFLVVVMGCDEEKQGPEDFFDNDGFKVELVADKALGHGQYVLKSESGQNIEVKVNVESPTALTSFKVRKTKNLVPDPTFGTNGEMTVAASGNSFSYDFDYNTLSTDVDQLVGFSFEAVNASGAKEVSDLTMQITLSPRDNIPQKKWNLTSILQLTDKNKEVINDCEKDNAILFNQDGSMVYIYGSDTGAGSCQFDGFNLYDKWNLSEDEKTFTISYQGLFNPATTVDTYQVRLLSTDELKLELTVDLTVLGLGVETFLYTYKAGPK